MPYITFFVVVFALSPLKLDTLEFKALYNEIPKQLRQEKCNLIHCIWWTDKPMSELFLSYSFFFFCWINY